MIILWYVVVNGCINYKISRNNLWVLHKTIFISSAVVKYIKNEILLIMFYYILKHWNVTWSIVVFTFYEIILFKK